MAVTEWGKVIGDGVNTVGQPDLSEYALGQLGFPGIVSPRSTGWAVSINGGANFTDNGAIPPTAPANTTQGDAGDPVMARDTGNGTIYLLTNPSRETATWGGFRLWKSTDNGQSFSLVNTSVPSGVTRGDKPMIAVNNFSSSLNYHYLYVAGTATIGGVNGVFATHSSDGGATWDVPPSVLTAGGQAADLGVAPDGTVYVFYLVNGAQFNLQYSWRRPSDTSWQTPVTISAHVGSQSFYSLNWNASGNPKRSNSASSDDYFSDNGFPRVAVHPVSGRIYLVYADLPFAGSSTDRGDIFINEGVSQADGSLNWTGVRKLSNDGTATDQWNPSIAINPAGTQLFVGYYSRQGDPNNNALIKAYGAKANLANGFATATFDVFPVSATPFTNLFNGTATSTPPTSPWLFDNVWIQDEVCLDTNARVVLDCASSYTGGVGGYAHFNADDYTWSAADSMYFYFAWRDCSDTSVSQWNGNTYSRADANIRFGKIKQ